MTVETRERKSFLQNEDYQAFADIWQRCRDAVQGEDALKAQPRRYLATLPELSGDEYKAYVKRAMYYNTPGQTVSGLTGTVLRKPPIVTYPEAEADTLDTLGVQDQPLPALIRSGLSEILTVGRIGYLVDSTAASDEIPNPVPYVVQYKAESIWNWVQERVGERLTTTVWVLHERVSVSGDPVFGSGDTVDQWRVLRLGREPPLDDKESIQLAADGDSAAVAQFESGIRREFFGRESELEERLYWQEIWRKQTTHDGKRETGKVELVRVVVPTKTGGVFWREIPFQIVNQSSETPEVQSPPLLSLVNVAISNFRDSADLQWGLFWTAIPTPWVAGLQDGKDPTIGAARLLSFSEPDAKMAMLEFTGKGLGAIESVMKRKEQLMANLGSRLMDDQKAGVEAAEAIRLRLHGTLRPSGRSP